MCCRVPVSNKSVRGACFVLCALQICLWNSQAPRPKGQGVLSFVYRKSLLALHNTICGAQNTHKLCCGAYSALGHPQSRLSCVLWFIKRTLRIRCVPWLKLEGGHETQI